METIFGAGFGAVTRGRMILGQEQGLIEWRFSCVTRTTSYGLVIKRH